MKNKFPFLSQLVAEEALTSGTLTPEELQRVEHRLGDALLANARLLLTPDEFFALLVAHGE